jgi:RNA polymerase sigma-70 factor (ECF subfamily)
MSGEILCVPPARAASSFEEVMDDRAQVAAARSGDEDAFADLVRRHSGGLHRSVARILGDDTEAWDVVQMAFVRAWERLDRYNARWSFATWLYRIGTNLAIDVLRSRSSRERAHRAGGEHRLRLVGEARPASELADHREVDRLLAQLVEALTPQQRGAFVLREIDGMDTSEVAQVLGCSATTVRNHVFQARKILRRELETRFPEYLPRANRGCHAV